MINPLRQAYPTQASKNEICFDFVTRICYRYAKCHRIHPHDKNLFKPQVYALKKLARESRLTQALFPSPESGLEFSTRDTEPTIISTPVKHPSPQPAKIRLTPSSSSKFEKNRAFSASLAGIWQQRPIQPSENQNHIRSRFTDDVHNWDILDGLHPVSKADNTSSDTSSVSEVLGKHREPCWDSDTGHWETYANHSAWDDSDGTTEDIQTTSEGRRSFNFNNEAPILVPQAPTTNTSSTNRAQVPPVKEWKHPRPKINERCRKWLRNECQRGYQCLYVHEDLEYDDPPVSLIYRLRILLHVRVLTGAPEESRKIFNCSS